MTRIQFDIEGDLEARYSAIIDDKKLRHAFARKALEEWVTRQEARSERARRDALKRDAEAMAETVQYLVDQGLVTIRS